MTGMPLRLLPAFILPALLLFAACSGGSGGEEEGFRANLTDPASVPTLTRDDNPVLFTIAPDGSVSTEGEGATAGRTATPVNNGATAYTVQSGDTCSSIASAFDITSAALLDANPLIDDDCGNLRPDQSLRIPGSSGGSGSEQPTPSPTPSNEPADPTPTATEPPFSGGSTYTLESGDFCGSIAEDFGVSLDDFMAVNGLNPDSCTRLDVGDVVIIP